MAKQVINTNTPDDLINVGTSANSRNGASIRSAFIAVNDAFDKVDANFTELYNTIAAGGVVQVNADWNATTGMAQILNKPFVPDPQVHSDWNAVSGLAQILNKPTIPAAQVQSDWTQANNTSADFIKNKPSIPSIAGLATETYVDTAVSDLVDSSPAALNTLNELAAALNDDVNFSTTVTNLIAAKAELSDLTWSNVTGKPTFATVAHTGSYNNLDDKPVIPTVPTNVSAFTNDANYVTSSSINLSAVAQNIVPDSDLTRYLGSPTKRWHSLYVGTGSVYIGDAVLSLTAGKLNSSVGFSTDSISVGGVDLTVNQAGQIASSAGFAVDNLSIGGVDITINQAGQIESSAGFAVTASEVLPTDAVGFLQNDGTGVLTWGTPASSLDDLTDVDTSSNAPTAGDVLKWDGLRWIPAPDLLAGGVGLDADTLDGQHGSYYLNYNNLTNTPSLFSGSYNDLTNTPSLFSGSYTDLSNKPSLFSGSYNDLTNKPTIPSLSGYATESYVGTAIANLVDTAPATLNTLNELAAALGDDPNFATTIATAIGNKADTSSLAAVATSGSYADLTNKPSLFSGSYTDLTNKPTLFDGAYASLSGKPALFSGSYTDLTNKPNLFSGSYTDLTNKPDFKEILYINDIKDVDTFTVTPTTGMVLKFNGSSWVGGALSYANLTNTPTIPSDISDLTDTGNLLGSGGGTGADGASAYEVAVANGFVGNEATWLASLVGADGAAGPRGDTGAQGIPGSTGAQGAPGAKGDKGDTGDQGVSVTLQGTKATIADLPAAPVNPADFSGHGWIVTTGDGLTHLDGSLWFWNLTDSVWNDIGPIVGPQGDAGAQGPAGSQGAQGAQGPAGADGVDANPDAVVNGLLNITLNATGDFIPSTDILQDLGSPTNRFRHVYVGPGSVYIGSNVITESATGGLVLPGVTRATGYYAEEVDGEDDWGSNPTITGTVTVIDALRYQSLAGLGTPSVNYNPATYTVQKDGNRIDEINVSNGGSGWTKAEADYARNNNMYATNVVGAINNFNSGDWVQIPFRVEVKAEDTEYEDIFGGGASNLSDLNDVQLDGPSEGQVLTWNNSQEKWENRDASGGNADTGDITFNGDQIGSTTDAVNINASEYAQLQSNNNYIWVDGNGATVEIGDGEGSHEFLFEYNSGSPRLKLPNGGDIVDSNGTSVLGGSGNTGLIRFDGASTAGIYNVNGGGITISNFSYQTDEAETAYISIPAGNSSDSLLIKQEQGPVAITAENKTWEFDTRGALRLPEGGDILDSNGDSVLGGGSGATTVARQDTPPATGNGSLWFNTVEGRLYIKYSDQWVDAAPLMMPTPQVDIDVATITFPDATVQTTAFTGFNNKIVNNDYEVVLDQAGALNLPHRGVIRNLGGTHDVNLVAAGSSGYAQLQWTTDAGAAEDNPNGTDEPLNWVYVEEPGIFIETNVNSLTGDRHSWTFGADGKTTLPGAVANSTVAKTGGGVGTETAIDLTKTVNKLTDGRYTLADGEEGQIMYLVRQAGATTNGVTVVVANGRISGILYTSVEHYPFSGGTDNIDIDTLIFTDGAWQASNSSWD